jgi:hypothetical protein
MDISLYFAYSPSIEVSVLSKINSTVAAPTGFLELEPLNITSVIESPRNRLAELSPITHLTASITLDLPHPLGPTTPTKFDGNVMTVGSTKDLKPASFTLLNRIYTAKSMLIFMRINCNAFTKIKRIFVIK